MSEPGGRAQRDCSLARGSGDVNQFASPYRNQFDASLAASTSSEGPASRDRSKPSFSRTVRLFALTLEDQSQVYREQHKMHCALHHVGSPARERDDAYDQG